MKIKFKILAYVSIGIGIYFLLTAIWFYKEKNLIETILENGNKEVGIIERVNTKKEDKILIRLSDTTISKKIIDSENYYEVGDTVRLYNYAKYPDKYVFEYDYIDNLAIIAGLILTAIFLLPIILLMKKK
nr:hypothetical protein [uncultured Draconibacterium sp.]